MATPYFQDHYDAAGNICRVEVPRYVFKFAMATDYTLESVREAYLWFSRPSEFNDVFELPVKTRIEYSRDEIRDYFRANLPYHAPKMGLPQPDGAELERLLDKVMPAAVEQFPAMLRSVHEFKRNSVRLHCFSVRYDDPLMWAHYAASFAGFCLVYDFTQLFSAGPWVVLPVEYRDQPPAYDAVGQSLRHLSASTPYANHQANEEHDRLLFGTKLSSWSHEQELRLCTLSEQPRQEYPRSALVGVILGPRTTPEVTQAITEAASTGRECVTVGRLVVDTENNALSVEGLANYTVELNIAGVRNLSREKLRGDLR